MKTLVYSGKKYSSFYTVIKHVGEHIHEVSSLVVPSNIRLCHKLVRWASENEIECQVVKADLGLPDDQQDMDVAMKCLSTGPGRVLAFPGGTSTRWVERTAREKGILTLWLGGFRP